EHVPNSECSGRYTPADEAPAGTGGAPVLPFFNRMDWAEGGTPRLWTLVLLVCLFAGCATRPGPSFKASPTDAVRNVLFLGTPEHPDLAEKARQLGNLFYPQIYAVLGDGGEHRQFDIVFRKDLARHYKLSVKRTTQNMPKMMNYYPSGVAAGGHVYL